MIEAVDLAGITGRHLFTTVLAFRARTLECALGMVFYLLYDTAGD